MFYLRAARARSEASQVQVASDRRMARAREQRSAGSPRKIIRRAPREWAREREMRSQVCAMRRMRRRPTSRRPHWERKLSLRARMSPAHASVANSE